MATASPRPSARTPLPADVEVPEVVVQRLPLYVRVLRQFDREGVEVVSSEQLGDYLQMTPAQIRKDLSYFGRFGKQGRGYNVKHLASALRSILGLDSTWNAAIIGMGRLGRAIASYPGFGPEGFRIVAAFDADPAVVGTSEGDLQIQSVAEIPATVKSRNIKIGIVAVPSRFAQLVVDAVVRAGITSVLNYAPMTPQVPPGVKIRSIDPVLALQSMTYYMK